MAGAATLEPLTLGASALSVRVQIIEGPCSAVLEGRVHTPSGETPHVLAP